MMESVRHALPAISSVPGSVMRTRLMLLAKIEGFRKETPPRHLPGEPAMPLCQVRTA